MQLKQLEVEKVFMQRELDDLTAQTKMRASISKEELAAVSRRLRFCLIEHLKGGDP